jgi:hypothetical protein
MRTTLTLDDDVLEHARTVACKLRLPFRTVVNEALRMGLKEVARPAMQRPYRMVPHDMGLRTGYSLDNVADLLAHAEGEDFR